MCPEIEVRLKAGASAKEEALVKDPKSQQNQVSSPETYLLFSGCSQDLVVPESACVDGVAWWKKWLGQGRYSPFVTASLLVAGVDALDSRWNRG